MIDEPAHSADTEVISSERDGAAAAQVGDTVFLLGDLHRRGAPGGSPLFAFEASASSQNVTPVCPKGKLVEAVAPGMGTPIPYGFPMKGLETAHRSFSSFRLSLPIRGRLRVRD